MKKAIILLFALIYSAAQCQAQEIHTARVIFYNTENFFDTIKDPVTDDGEFTPAGKAHWTAERYQHKLTNISKVLRLMTEKIPPLFIGLGEIENKHVSEDIASHPNLSKYDLGVIEQDSPDPRGIDMALLYNKKLVTIVASEFLTVKLPDIDRGTRDILYIKGIVGGGDLHVFVSHFPSRREGRLLSEPRRMAAVQVIKNKISQIKALDSSAYILIMGDMNDNPTDSSMVYGFGAREPEDILARDTLYDLMSKPYRDGQYTLRYRGENDVFDQMIVSANLLNTNTPIHLKTNVGNIFKERWLLYDSPKYGLMPNRTYIGTKYIGGFSDHLPVYIDIILGN